MLHSKIDTPVMEYAEYHRTFYGPCNQSKVSKAQYDIECHHANCAGVSLRTHLADRPTYADRVKAARTVKTISVENAVRGDWGAAA